MHILHAREIVGGGHPRQAISGELPAHIVCIRESTLEWASLDRKEFSIEVSGPNSHAMCLRSYASRSIMAAAYPAAIPSCGPWILASQYFPRNRIAGSVTPTRG
jgi:hypothetical protein